MGYLWMTEMRVQTVKKIPWKDPETKVCPTVSKSVALCQNESGIEVQGCGHFGIKRT